MPITTPEFELTYNGTNITADVSLYYTSCEYTDHTEGTSDEITLTLDDTDAYWRGPWYPEKGATLELTIISGERKLSCGKFEIDEIEQSGPPHMVTLKALAAGVGPAIRTKNNKAYDKTTLKGIAQTIAAKHGMTVVGEIETIPIERATQYRQKDLEYLRSISIEYGYVFSIRDKKLVFTTQEKLEKSGEILTIDLTEFVSYSFRDKAVEVYKESKVSYRDPKTNQTITAKAKVDEIANQDGIGFSYVTSGDKANSYSRVENKQQATTKARALLYRKNTKQNEGSITVEGDPRLVAGINIQITGLGVLSGKYHVLSSRHSISKTSGYITEIEVKRVGGAKNKQAQAPKKIKRPVQPVATVAPTPASGSITNTDGITFRTSGGNA